jgi:outer membrane protein insertion porin family
MESAYQDLGYQAVVVEPRTEFSEGGTRVDVAFLVQEGPRVFVDRVLIVGNVRTSTDTIERELQTKPGDPSARPRSTRASASCRRSGCSGACRSPSCATPWRRRAICW